MTGASSPGHSIGPYPIEREVGRGGMGIVYLGRDPRLDRPVAIKVLPETFALDPERAARFEREARLLASLNHPNIAAIHGLEESSGRRFLVLEYVEGETLAQRIARGPLPVDEAIEVGRQIAAALEAAHERGVIHRDLKPGNVKLTPAGEVKVLDFGLAKGGVASEGSSDPSLSESPTESHVAATGAGVILGTAAYMSPEQARGRPLDRRTDIWSFGCVMYECLSGRPAFAGETVSDLIAVILQGEPDWKALPANTPPRLHELIVRCLAKDAKKRLRDIGEARLLLEGGEVSQGSGVYADLAGASARRAPGVAAWLAAIFALSTLVLAGILIARRPEPASVRRVSVSLPVMPPPPRDPALAALSPDGTKIASTAIDSTGEPYMWVRSLDRIEGAMVPGSEGGGVPAWSPDGNFLVFSTRDRMKKVDLRGGRPETICPIASYGRGMSWGSRGVIVFAGGPEGPISKVPAQGGTPLQATTLGPGETGHRYPQFLPDGRHFLYAAMPPHGGQFAIWIGSTDDAKQREKLFDAEGVPLYVEPGWLLFARNSRVVAQRFDAGARKLRGEPLVLQDEPARTQYLGAPWLTAGRRGPFAYFVPAAPNARLAWTTLGGPTQPLPIRPGPYELVRLSPDGRKAMVVHRTSPMESDLWLIDLERIAMTRFTVEPGSVDRPIWSPDGSRVAYASNRNGTWDILVKGVGAVGPGEAVLEGGSIIKYPDSWTPDGQAVLVELLGEKTGWDIVAAPVSASGPPRPVLDSAADELFVDLSHDGRWITYVSNESGRDEVYVDAYPGLGRRIQVSTSGGLVPRWSRDGRELVYRTYTGGLALVSFDPGSGSLVGAARTVSIADGVNMDFSHDLRRVLTIVPEEGAHTSDDITLVDHWRRELKSR